MYIAGPEDIVRIIIKVIIREGSSSDGGSVRNLQTDVRSCSRQVWAVLRTVLQTWTELYGHPHGICRFIGLYGHSAVVSCVGYLLCGFGSHSFCWAPYWAHVDPPIALTIVHCDGTPTLALYNALIPTVLRTVMPCTILTVRLKLLIIACNSGSLLASSGLIASYNRLGSFSFK